MSFSEYRAAGGPNSRENQKKELKRLQAKIKQHQSSLARGQGGVGQVKKSTEYNAWLKKNTGTKLMPDGSKQIVWKTGDNKKKGTPFNEKLGQEQFKQDQFGTTTPYQDLQYLQQLDKNEAKLKGRRANQLRIKTSQEDFEGKNIYLLETDQLEAKQNKEAEELRKRTSYANIQRDETPPTDQLTIGNNNTNPTNNEKENNNYTNEGGGNEAGGADNQGNGGGAGAAAFGEGNYPDITDMGSNKAQNNQTKSADNVGPARMTAREKMRAQNVERFGGGEAGEWHVSKVGERHEAWKEARKSGTMDQFRKDYGENLGQYLANERHKLKIDPKKKKKINVNTKSQVA